MSLLGQKLSGTIAAAASAPKGLSRVLAAGRRGELVTLPHLGPAWVELQGAISWEEVQIAARQELEASGLALDLRTAELLEMKLARHTLARAVRDPDDRALAFGTLDEWGALDPDVINSAWQVYGDVRERLDPMSSPLTEAERVAIDLAIKKKEGPLLRSFGISRLVGFLLSTDDRPSTSPLPSSSSSE